MNEYLTVGEAAAVLRLSRRALLDRIARGDLGARRAGARLWLIPRTEIERARAGGRLRPGPRTKRPPPTPADELPPLVARVVAIREAIAARGGRSTEDVADVIRAEREGRFGP